jgi:imidazoleglycerol-phosphate dehydratase
VTRVRKGETRRTTSETDIALSLTLDGSGRCDIDTGVGFFDHMLTAFAVHGRFDLTVKCMGDLHVDAHHTAEDVGMCLGRALAAALGDKRGIARYGDAATPMDEALTLCAADVSGRGVLSFDLPIPSRRIGAFDTELIKEFFAAFTRASAVTLHIRGFGGENSHHIAESCFKTFGRALRECVQIDISLGGAAASSKGVL